ncbi:monovalent cation/H+ antiporter complex subunit F [Promicromonospora sp. NPDC019610]|uniref:monovalent cation/H+ antiporter complex subunit F n=1 Tax=Promicromonospora sp. NPDC019610 TaxID=3364405 RepID=UPI0037B93CA8
MMLAVGVVATALLAVGALLAVVRIERGPTMLDRTVAFDVLTTALVGAIAVEAAISRRTESVPILVVLSLVGFIGSVTIARFAAVEPPKNGTAAQRSGPRPGAVGPGPGGSGPGGSGSSDSGEVGEAGPGAPSGAVGGREES